MLVVERYGIESAADAKGLVIVIPEHSGERDLLKSRQLRGFGTGWRNLTLKKSWR